MFFSVIVPVYNGEDYLKECVDSILGQTFSELELILVDDGSTDGTGRLCDEFAGADNRVRVVHQRNAGLPGARQAGIMRAKGDYVLYVDADDWIAPGLLEDAAGQLGEGRVDMVAYAFENVQGGKRKQVFEPVPAGVYDRDAMRRAIYPLLLQGANMKNMLSQITGKVIRRQLLYEKQMLVSRRLELGEDAACTIGIYLGSALVCIRERVMYYYRVHEASSSHRFRMEQYRQAAVAIRYFERLAVPEVEDFDRQIDRYAMMAMFCLMLSAIESGGWRKLPAIKKTMEHPILREHVKRAEFDALTPKTRIVCFLYKKGLVVTAWIFLALCGWVKERMEGICQKRDS